MKTTRGETRNSAAPAWALALTAQVCAEHGRRAPKLQWWNTSHEKSSGWCATEGNTIRVSAGTSVIDQQLVLLHEIAHHLTRPRAKHRDVPVPDGLPGRGVIRSTRRNWHSKRFWEKAFELFARWGDPEFFIYAYDREKDYRKKAAAIGK